MNRENVRVYLCAGDTRGDSTARTACNPSKSCTRSGRLPGQEVVDTWPLNEPRGLGLPHGERTSFPQPHNLMPRGKLRRKQDVKDLLGAQPL